MTLRDLRKGFRDLQIRPRLVLIVSAGLWLGSLALPALRAKGEDAAGLFVLAWGWLGPFTFTFAWYGNLFWLVGAIAMALGKPPPLLVVVPGLLLASTSLLGVTMADDTGSYPATLLSGAYLWLASYACQLVGALAGPSPRTPTASN